MKLLSLISLLSSIPTSLSLNLPAAAPSITTPIYNVQCDSQRFGSDLILASCVNAWRKIKTTTKWTIYADRGKMTKDFVPLPYRYISDDGTCAIDILVQPGAKGDVITGVGISRAAKDVIDSCVATRSAIGGEKTNFRSPRHHPPLRPNRHMPSHDHPRARTGRLCENPEQVFACLDGHGDIPEKE
ncbi:MAG: hypothetical protein Q9207_008552 [Kuettlingeria erythrocarpa]